MMYRQVVWNFPKALYERLEKTKGDGQQAGDIPKDIADESFAMFLLDRALSIYEETLKAQAKKDNLIVEPGAPVYDPAGAYRGMRTPIRA